MHYVMQERRLGRCEVEVDGRSRPAPAIVLLAVLGLHEVALGLALVVHLARTLHRDEYTYGASTRCTHVAQILVDVWSIVHLARTHTEIS